jgi:hypothetical protein
MTQPSGVRVFAKSLHFLAAGWLASVAWLWIATVQQHRLRWGQMPDDYAMGTIVWGAASTLVIEIVARWLVGWCGSAPEPNLEFREWHHAFWWSFIPNVLLLGTAYLMIVGAA